VISRDEQLADWQSVVNNDGWNGIKKQVAFGAYHEDEA